MDLIKRFRALLPVLAMIAAHAAGAETQYVTDKLILGVYPNSDGSGQQQRVVRSGAALEVQERVGRYARILTEDGDEGWVKSQYLVSEPPAVLRIVQLNEELEQLRAGLNDPDAALARNLELQEQIVSLEKNVQSSRQKADSLQQELELAQQALEQANASTRAAEQSLAEAQSAAAAARAEAAAASAAAAGARAGAGSATAGTESGDEGSRGNGAVAAEVSSPLARTSNANGAEADDSGLRLPFDARLFGAAATPQRFYGLLAASAVVLLLLGCLLGYKGLDIYIRRQHGGYRVW